MSYGFSNVRYFRCTYNTLKPLASYFRREVVFFATPLAATCLKIFF